MREPSVVVLQCARGISAFFRLQLPQLQLLEEPHASAFSPPPPRKHNSTNTRRTSPRMLFTNNARCLRTRLSARARARTRTSHACAPRVHEERPCSARASLARDAREGHVTSTLQSSSAAAAAIPRSIVFILFRRIRYRYRAGRNFVHISEKKLLPFGARGQRCRG